MNHSKRWNRYYESLIKYQQRFGDALVPTSHVEFIDDGEELYLGNWVSYMRTRFKNNNLSQERIRLLENIPTWEWGPIRPGPKSKQDVLSRNSDILHQYNSGVSLASIARKYGLSRQRIHQIVKESI